MKRFLTVIIWAGALTVSFYLYQLQLGAIAFILLSLYFFIYAKKEFSKPTTNPVNKMKHSSRGKASKNRSRNK